MKFPVLRLIAFLLAFTAAVSFIGCRYIEIDDPTNDNNDQSQTTTTKKPDVKITIKDIQEEQMLIEVLDIGKADCIILYADGYTVMIDAGESDNKQSIFSRMILNGISKIDYLIITHFDKDHIGSVPALLETYTVQNIIEPDYTPEEPFNEEYLLYKAALEASSVPNISTISEDMSFTLGSMSFEIFAPHGADYHASSIDNNNSLVIGLEHKGNTFLFAGDIERLRIIDILADGIGHYDFLKVPHHGMNNNQSKNFIDAVQPSYSVITCSKKNPADVVLVEKLKAVGSKVYLTDEGIVYAISSSAGIEVMQ